MDPGQAIGTALGMFAVSLRLGDLQGALSVHPLALLLRRLEVLPLVVTVTVFDWPPFVVP
jgi:hypothetical protein